MRTIALRFAENPALECGTIAAHQALIDQNGFVWFAKSGQPISATIVNQILDEQDPRILLIQGGCTDCWWAHITDIQRELPPAAEIPSYYRDKAANFKCWFKVTRFEAAANNVMSQCFVTSSKRPLSLTSRFSISPHFIIDYFPNCQQE